MIIQKPLYVRILLNLILCICSYFLLKKKGMVAIGCRDSTRFSGNPKYFFLYLCEQNSKFKPVWVTSNPAVLDDLKRKGLSAISLYSLKGFFTILFSEFLVFDDTTRAISYFGYLPGRFKKIQTWHGSAGIKEITPTVNETLPIIGRFLQILSAKERDSWNLVLTCSHSWKIKYSNRFQKDRIKILGYPRNDIFFDRSKRFRNYKKDLNLTNFEKVILYCPTFRNNFKVQRPFSFSFYEKLNEYLREHNFVFLDKRHELEQGNFSFIFSNIKNISDKVDDIQDLLIDADILITDYSSVFADFCLSNKPIIFYPYDIESFSNERKLLVDYFRELPGPFAINEDKLLELLLKTDVLLTNGNNKTYCKLKDKYHLYKDGNSSKRLEKHLDKLSN